jgi:hypothetical protein
MGSECAECSEAGSELIATRDGDGVCADCISKYYVACHACRELVARDETREADGCRYCTGCFETTFGPGGHLSEEDVEAVVAEYIALDAEAKRIEKQLDALKDQIKAIAATRERVSGTVMLGRGDHRVTCTFVAQYKLDVERAAALEATLGPDLFGSYFERKLAVNRSAVDRLLSSSEPTDIDLRAAVGSVVDLVESPRVTVPRTKRPSAKAGGDG